MSRSVGPSFGASKTNPRHQASVPQAEEVERSSREMQQQFSALLAVRIARKNLEHQSKQHPAAPLGVVAVVGKLPCCPRLVARYHSSVVVPLEAVENLPPWQRRVERYHSCCWMMISWNPEHPILLRQTQWPWIPPILPNAPKIHRWHSFHWPGVGCEAGT